MNVQEIEINEAFRAEVREWMNSHLTGRFASLGTPVDWARKVTTAQLAKEWEQELAKGGWTGIGWSG